MNGLDSCKELLYWGRARGRRHAGASAGLDPCASTSPVRARRSRLSRSARRTPTRANGGGVQGGRHGWSRRATAADAEPHRHGRHLAGRLLRTPRAVAFGRALRPGARSGGAQPQLGRGAAETPWRGEGENPVPALLEEHVHWVFGAEDMDDFLEKSKGMTLNGVMDRISRSRSAITHGERDRQIDLQYARQSYGPVGQLDPKREPLVFTDREGGVEHVGVDNMSFGRDFIADWIAETFGEHTA
ncbi:hypothetical protein ACRAWD_31975 [Caulobacter segnis]